MQAGQQQLLIKRHAEKDHKEPLTRQDTGMQAGQQQLLIKRHAEKDHTEPFTQQDTDRQNGQQQLQEKTHEKKDDTQQLLKQVLEEMKASREEQKEMKTNQEKQAAWFAEQKRILEEELEKSNNKLAEKVNKPESAPESNQHHIESKQNANVTHKIKSSFCSIC